MTEPAKIECSECQNARYGCGECHQKILGLQKNLTYVKALRDQYRSGASRLEAERDVWAARAHAAGWKPKETP